MEWERQGRVQLARHFSLSSTTSSYWLDEALLAEALAHVRERRSALDENGDADSDDTQEE